MFVIDLLMIEINCEDKRVFIYWVLYVKVILMYFVCLIEIDIN